MPSTKDALSTETPEGFEAKTPSTEPTKPTQHCTYFLNRRCKFERTGGCPRLHDDTLRKKKTDERLSASRSKLQTRYTKHVFKTLCKNYLENHCNDHSCPRTHDYLRQLQFMDKAREYINNALITLKSGDNTKVMDADAEDTTGVVTKFCYYYQTGSRCSRYTKAAECPFKHDIHVRRAVIKALGGKNLLDVVVCNAKEADSVLESLKHVVFPHAELMPKQASIPTTETSQPTNNTTPPATKDASEAMPTSTALTKKNRYKNRKAFQKVPIVPYPQCEIDDNPSSTVIQGGWARPAWWSWGFANLKTIREAAIFIPYIKELEAGRVPKALMEKWSKRASKDAQFKYFGILPFELREHIWKYALKDQKSTLRIKFSHELEFGHKKNVKLTNHNLYAPMFYVCSQSRQLAIKDYEVRFGTVHNPGNIYINYFRDRVFFHTKTWDELSYMARYMKTFHASRIRHIVLPIRDFICGNEMITCDTLPFFVNVRDLTLWAGDGLQDLKLLTPGDIKYHVKGISSCVTASWRRFLPGIPPPKVHFEFIDAIQAHYYGIDGLAFGGSGA